jgi:hypothetical protein
MQISSFIFILKIKQKSGIPFLPIHTFPESFNKICLKKWLWALMGQIRNVALLVDDLKGLVSQKLLDAHAREAGCPCLPFNYSFM